MLTRRRLLKSAAASGLVVGASSLAAPAIAQGRRIRIGYVTPQTGPLAAFAEADRFTVDQFMAQTGDMYEVFVRDTQSSPTRASTVTQELIIDNDVDLLLVNSTPETTNPVATVAEFEGIPVISTGAPWQPWFIGQQGNPNDPSSFRPFDYAYHYFWGLEDIVAVYSGMWNQLETNKTVGGLFPNDADGNAWGDPQNGIAPPLAELGYTVVDPGRFQSPSDDFSSYINAFSRANADIITGVVPPPDFTTFFSQAAQRGYHPQIITMAKALLFPQAVQAIGRQANNLSTEVWWTPNHPFTSSLTGQSAAELAAAFTEATGRPWTQPIGFTHSLFEMAHDVMTRADDPTDPDLVAETIAASDLNTIVGNVSWDGEGVPDFAAKNVTKTPLVGGQWRYQDDGTFDLVIVENTAAPEIPVGGEMQPIQW